MTLITINAVEEIALSHLTGKAYIRTGTAHASGAAGSADQVFLSSTSLTSCTCRLCLDFAANLITACVDTSGTCRRSSL